MEKWIEEYIKLMFLEKDEDINIEAANKIMADHTPKRLFKYQRVAPHTLENLNKDSLSLSEATQFNDPFECFNIAQADDELLSQVRITFMKTYKNIYGIFTNEEFEKLDNLTNEDFFKEIMNKSDEINKIKETYPEFDLEKFILFYSKKLAETQNMKASNFFQENTYICSLSEVNDSILMWGHYTENFTGFCVEYDFTEVLYKSIWCMLKPVIYQNQIPDFSKYYKFDAKKSNKLISIYSAMIKSEEWSYEKEWRLILPLGKQKDLWFLTKAPKPKKIYLGVKMSHEDESKIIEIAKAKKIKVYKMNYPKNNFKITFHEIEY